MNISLDGNWMILSLIIYSPIIMQTRVKRVSVMLKPILFHLCSKIYKYLTVFYPDLHALVLFSRLSLRVFALFFADEFFPFVSRAPLPAIGGQDTQGVSLQTCSHCDLTCSNKNPTKPPVGWNIYYCDFEMSFNLISSPN